MTALAIAAIGAAGVLLLASALPVGRRIRLVDRVEPYVAGGGSGGHRPRAGGGITGAIAAWARVAAGDARLTERLTAARSHLDPPSFRMQQIVWGAGALAGAVLLVLALIRAGARPEPGGVAVLAGIAFASGVCGRDWFLSRQIASRSRRLNDELPVAIDLMTLTLMAGGSVPAACERVAAVLPDGVGREVRDALEDMKGGRTPANALRDLASRVGHPQLSRLIEALCTGLERGTPLSDVLRGQAQDIREERRRRLIEMGGRREVLMLVPVVFLILPAVVVTALFPALYSLDLLVP